MCFSAPKIQTPKAPAPTPTVDDDAVRNRESAEAARLASQSGRAATVVSDLKASDVGGQRRVLLGV